MDEKSLALLLAVAIGCIVFAISFLTLPPPRRRRHW